ncbi:hypothetical protein [Falsibacillus albus]|uniref:Uncharacterized protein n=1 Tax=Falsibacillus albus TaxID=2478915 RepID=A0A3L7K1D0_9BACI|nr:hypothetical protein [Falsibacillus albus]RLQ96189.1 hypothetical protein D9X91_07820 [Falsibacillus albus]
METCINILIGASEFRSGDRQLQNRQQKSDLMTVIRKNSPFRAPKATFDYRQLQKFSFLGTKITFWLPSSAKPLLFGHQKRFLVTVTRRNSPFRAPKTDSGDRQPLKLSLSGIKDGFW